MIFCATDGVRALALLEVLHFISPRRGRLCSRRNARSFSPPGLVGRCVGCAGTFRFIFVAREPLFPVIFGLERALGPFSFSHLVARGAALLGRKKKRNGRPPHRNPKHALSPYLSSSLSMILAREAAIFCSIGREAKRKRKVSHRSWFLAVNEAKWAAMLDRWPFLVVCDFSGVCKQRRPVKLCRFEPFTCLFLNVFGWVKIVGRTSFVFKFPFLCTVSQCSVNKNTQFDFFFFFCFSDDMMLQLDQRNIRQ